jgi:ABC-type amino acid transport substrate-binding protein
MMNKFLHIIFVFIISLSITAKDTLNVGVFNIVPYGYLKTGVPTGIIPDILKELEKDSKLNFNLNLLPYKRMIKSLENGSSDFSIFFISETSKKVSTGVIPLYDLKTIVIPRKGLKIDKLKDLNKYQLATPRGVKYNLKVLNDQNAKIFRVLDYNHALDMLNTNRVDAVIGPEKILNYQIKILGLNREDFGKSLLITKNTAWIQFSKKSKHLKHIEQIKKSAQNLKKENKIDSIIQSYYK